ncbi:putative 3-methyladenine DNA glycosylase [Bradysia coprophila]|uniref:putative 3-methyladenine DNA glycosylase n=1 Tax=Bradysia coprophila TaxID=38358 RepID=UPI00187DCAF7|nr:putative 3-methyladenine DNA glycosylase [Bradysia coprophila]
MKRATTAAAAVKNKLIKKKNTKTETSGESVTPNTKQLSREFYRKPCEELSKALLGKVLVRQLPHGEIIKGTIVETEAYPGTNVDEASASYNGKVTDKNRAMFMDPGTAYVYMTYGMYHCFNISSEGEGAACLLRAIEPLEEYETMQKFRQKSRKKSSAAASKKFPFHELTNGPSKLCMAFDVRRENCDKMDLCTSSEMWLEDSDDSRFNRKENLEIVAAKRIGIDRAPVKARDKLFRFYIKDNMFVSTVKPSEIVRAAQSGSGDESNE